MNEIQKNVKEAFLFLRENNNTIPSDHLELFKNVLNDYFAKAEAHKDGVVIVPAESAKFCADQTIASMNRQAADFGDNEEIRKTYMNHARALHFASN